MLKDRDSDDKEHLVDLMFETSMPLSEIAKELNWSINKLNREINRLGLSWLKDSRKKMSRGQTALTLIMKKLLPGEKIVNEFHIGDKLKLDVYCPKYQVAAEYHGRQHFFYTQRFFESKYEFEESVERDEKKARWCKENGIALVVFRYNDKLTEEAVFERLMQAIRTSPFIPKEKSKKSIVDTTAYKMVKKKNSEYRKKTYKLVKEKRNADRRKRNKQR
jgi:hypothetical protein